MRMSTLMNSYQQRNKVNRCFFFKNTHQTPFNIKKLTLFYTLKKETSLKALVRFSTLLEMLTRQRSCFIRSTKSSVFLKIRKGAPSGVKITLRRTRKENFLTMLIWKVLSNIKTFRKISKFPKVKKENLNSLMLSVSEPLVFSELRDFYFYFKSCFGMRILISFSGQSRTKETLFNSRFSQIPLI